MSLTLRHSTTATGKAELIVGSECHWDEFPTRAQQVVADLGMEVHEEIDSLDVRMWIATVGESAFCISWDIWVPTVSIIAWEQTSEAAVRALTDRE